MDDWEDDFVVIEDKDPSNPQDSLDGAEQGIDSFNPEPQTVLPPSAPVISDLNSVYQCEFPDVRTGDSITHRNIQTQAFCGWLSYVLRKENPDEAIHVTDLCATFTNSHQLGHIVCALTGKKVTGLVEAQNAYDKIMNLELAMDAFCQAFPQATSVSASQVANNNQKVALDLAWILFYYSTLKPIDYLGLHDRFAILLWAQHQAANFPNTPVVSDFTTSFADGTVLCAIIETKVLGSLDTRSMSPITKAANLRRAFDAAEKHLAVPKLLSATDVTSNSPDEISILVYLTLLFHKCKS